MVVPMSLSKHRALASQLVSTGMLSDLHEQIRQEAFETWASITPEQATDGADQRERDKLLGRLEVLQRIENMALEP